LHFAYYYFDKTLGGNIMKKFFAMIFITAFILAGCSSGNQELPKEATKKLPPPMEEILDKVDDIENSATINFTNGLKYGNADEDRVIFIEVGSLKADPKQGVAMIIRKKQDGKLMSQTQHLSPSKHGALSIVKFNGTNLELKAEDGTIFQFNSFDGFR
jgi:PBP1b-binding outer membrane lipoprotein LpoB